MERLLVNLEFLGLFGLVDMEHLARTGSNHPPLFLTCGNQSTNYRRPFRFLNFWTKKEDFHQVVLDN